MTDHNQNPFHYTDSGLEDIWLLGGVEVHDTPYGPATSISNLDELHLAIGMSIAHAETMSAKEFRFLRVELDLSQKTLAGLLKSNEQQIHRWETGKVAIPGTAQVALAGYYIETMSPDGSLKDLMEQLAELDARISEMTDRYFVPDDDAWILSPAA